MIKNFTVLIIIFHWSIFSAQTGMYKNLFGDFGANVNTTATMKGMQKLSGNRHLVMTSKAYLSNTFSLSTFDEYFNPLWSSKYNGSASGSSVFSHSVELEDNSIVSSGVYGTSIFISRHNANGIIQFSKRYNNTTGIMYSLHTLCESNENDTSFVALVAECAVHHGLIKFKKDGSVVWAKNYSFTENNYANVYALDKGINSGYVSGGSNIGPVQDTIQHYGYLLVTNNDGTFKKGMKYQHTSNNYNSVLASRLLTSTDDYYVNFIYGNDYSGVWDYESNCIVAKLDSNLNLINQWRFSSPFANQGISFDRIHETSDNKLLLTGNITDTLAYPICQYFILKFNPNVPGGNIEWSKSFYPLVNYQASLSTIPLSALYTFGASEQIVFSYAAHLDGSCISSLDQNGLGHCQAFDRPISQVEVNDLITLPFAVNPVTCDVIAVDIPLISNNSEQNDTVFCAEGGLNVRDIFPQTGLVDILSNGEHPGIKNSCLNKISIEIYTCHGQKLLETELQPGEIFHFNAWENGAYLFKASQGLQSQTGKLIW